MAKGLVDWNFKAKGVNIGGVGNYPFGKGPAKRPGERPKGWAKKVWAENLKVLRVWVWPRGTPPGKTV